MNDVHFFLSFFPKQHSIIPVSPAVALLFCFKICFYFLLRVCLCVLGEGVAVCGACMNAGVHGVQKRASESLELELQVVVSITGLVLGNKTQVICKRSVNA